MGGLSLGGLARDEPVSLGRLTSLWTSATETTYTQNHHGFATVVVNESPLIAIPRNDIDGSTNCGAVGIDAHGDVVWEQSVSPSQCNPHALGDVGVGNFTAESTPEFVVATETGVFVLDSLTGSPEFTRDVLSSISYSAPVVVQSADATPRLIAIDFAGNLTVLERDGTIAWTKDLNQPVFVSPLVADVTGDGAPNILINHGRRSSDIVCFDVTGQEVWSESVADSVSWWTVTHSTAHPGIVASVNDSVVFVDGSGTVQWDRKIGRNPAVGASNHNAVFVGVRDGTLRSVSLESGSVNWTSRVTDASGHIPAPVLGRIRSSANRSVIAAARDGTLGTFDAESGELLARKQLSDTIYTSPRLLDITRDGTQDILVLTGTAQIKAFSYNQNQN